MATAVEPSEPRTPTTPIGLPILSLLGAIYVIAAIAAVFYAVPAIWSEGVASALSGFGFAGDLARWVVQIAAFAGLLWFGKTLLGTSPVKGVRGGIFLTLIAVTLVFFVWRWAALTFESVFVGLVIGVVLAVLAVKLFISQTGAGWMVAVEEQGWFSTAGYKKSLGVRARRLTILGILLLGVTGAYTLYSQGSLPNDWVLTLPFESPSSITLMPDARYAIPVALFFLTVWCAWRAVNVPTFAEFLIATEAEMNKVSWSPKKRLAQDTVVVLTTTLLMALFLLLVDLFWGWLLSTNIVGVLPSRSGTEKDKAGKAEQRAKW